MKKRPRKKDRNFLSFAKQQHGVCVLCPEDAQDVHHFGSGGMGMKGDDYLVVRLCRKCHEKARKVIAMRRDGDHETLALFLEDATKLLSAYIEREKEGGGLHVSEPF